MTKDQFWGLVYAWEDLHASNRGGASPDEYKQEDEAAEQLEAVFDLVERLRAENARLRETYSAAHEAHLKIRAENAELREQVYAWEQTAAVAGLEMEDIEPDEPGDEG